MSSINVVTVLAIVADHEQQLSLAEIFRHSKWNLDVVQTIAEARPVISELDTGVVISDSQLPDGLWQDVLQEASRKAVPLPLIVASGRADDRLWAEVLNLGGYDVLETPFHADEVFRSVSLAWRQSRDQWLLAARRRAPANQASRSSSDTPSQGTADTVSALGDCLNKGHLW